MHAMCVSVSKHKRKNVLIFNGDFDYGMTYTALTCYYTICQLLLLVNDYLLEIWICGVCNVCQCLSFFLSPTFVHFRCFVVHLVFAKIAKATAEIDKSQIEMNIDALITFVDQ